MFSKVNVIALFGFIGRFQQHLCPITLTVHKLMGPVGESTQLCDRTEHSVERGAIANHDFKGRFVCIVGCFTPFST